MDCYYVVPFAIFLFVPFLSLQYALEIPDNKTFSQWNEMLASKLHDFLSAATQIDFAQNIYRYNAAVRLQEVNGEEIFESVLQELGALFLRKKLALKRLIDAAEEKFSQFQKSNKSVFDLEQLSSTFIDMKSLEAPAKMSFSSKFRQPVSYEQSGVHIPLEILDGYSDMLNGLNWSASLDDTFKENLRNDPALRWQYFGSYFGFMRVYPAFRWPEHPSLPDLFDVRRRPWYIQGSVTPKDVIILIDRSGSVHGPTLEIMKITAKALLNSLGENDYVNVAWFNNKVKWVVPCLKTLVQATVQTRRLLADAVERLTESNLTSYANALDFAFDEFRKFDEIRDPWVGSNCHKIIMFLSDGGTEWPADLINRHCNESSNGQIKIFTFACGPHPIPTVILKEMACSTGGYFSPVTALGSVRVKIRDYIKVLSRPLAYSMDDNMYQWNNFYRDVGGLGTIATVTLPVFNRLSKDTKSAHLLGVMGIDIALEEIMEVYSKRLMGAFGYPFAINTNGFVVFHPRLHDHVVYIEDPPDVYLTDLEGASEYVKKMEKEMIDGVNGSLKQFPSIVPIGIGQAIVVDMNYFYGSVSSTSYRFGIALPSKHTSAKFKITDIEDSVKILSSLEGVFLAPWKFCSIGDFSEEFTVEKLVHQIRHNFTSCDEDLINHLLWDVKKVLKIKTHRMENRFPGLTSFLITTGGLTITFTSDEEYNGQTNPFKNNLYKRATRNSGFVVSVNREKRDTVTVARRIMINDSYVAAVIGAEVEQENIQDIFEETVGIEGEISCGSPELLHCYLLNDGGMITASNVRSSKSGDFIGVHDPEMLATFLSRGMFKREYRYNYQSWCSKPSQHVVAQASANRLSIWQFLYDAILTFHWNFVYKAFPYFISSVSGWKKSENSEQMPDNSNHTCVTRSAWYYRGRITSLAGAVNCGSRERSFRTAFLPRVDLIFLVTQPPCNDSSNNNPITLDSDEDVEHHHCENQHHYRIRPEKCYKEMTKEMPSDCGATSHSSVPLLLTPTPAFVRVSLLIILRIKNNFFM